MVNYVRCNGGLYLSPVVITDEYEYSPIQAFRINDTIYKGFHTHICKTEYRVGTIVRWDDYTMTFNYDPASQCVRELVDKYVNDNTKVYLRYDPVYDTMNRHNVVEMEIYCLDIPVIPFDVLGITKKELDKIAG